MQVSVIIPTFNRCRLVVRAIQSVIDQRYPIHEIIVIDDGSTDHSAHAIKNQFPRVCVIQQENQGVSAARNTGISVATGDWVALLDSDDTWHKQKILRQVQLIATNPSFIACHTDEKWIRNGRHVNAMNKHAKPEGSIYEQCLPLCCVSPSSVLIKRLALVDEGMFDESLPVCEDYDLWLRLFCKNRILLAPEFLVVKYGGHDDQLSRKHWGMDRFRVTALEKILESGQLDPDQANLTHSMLDKKLGILVNGFRKRDNHSQAEYYQAKLDKWSVTAC